MRDEAFDIGLEFIELCAGTSGVATLIDEFRSRIRAFGFSYSACGAWAGVGKHRVYRFFFNDWPADWIELYNQQNFFADDPYVVEARRRMTPFRWSELEKLSFSPRGRELFEIGRTYGWREVLGLPLHGPAGYQGLVTVATLRAVTLSPRAVAVLQLMAHAIHARCRSATDLGLPPNSDPHLTQREIESLQWAALGKTDWEIGQLMHVTAATAHYHIERAKKKLGVASRVQAVAMLVLRGLI